MMLRYLIPNSQRWLQLTLLATQTYQCLSIRSKGLLMWRPVYLKICTTLLQQLSRLVRHANIICKFFACVVPVPHVETFFFLQYSVQERCSSLLGIDANRPKLRRNLSIASSTRIFSFVSSVSYCHGLVFCSAPFAEEEVEAAGYADEAMDVTTPR